jgi:hypothetical protein
MVLGSTVVQAQEQTLRQLAIEHQGRIGRMQHSCGWSGPPLATIVRDADLVLEGTVMSRRTYATPDDLTAARPGPAPATIFKTRGGTVMFDGYPFSLTVNGNRALLNVGDRVVLFGRHDPSDGKWLFKDRGFFRVSNGIVVNTLPTFDGHPEGLEPRMSIAAFGERVREVALR